METFPEALGCWAPEGFTPTASQNKTYLGNRTSRDKPDGLKARFQITNLADLEALLTWWRDTVNSGLTPFSVNLPWFGVAPTEVIQTNALIASQDRSGTYSINFEFELVSTV